MTKILLGIIASISLLIADKVHLGNVTIMSKHKETKNSLTVNSNSGVTIGGQTLPSGHYNTVSKSTEKKIKNISLENVEVKERH